VTEQKLEESLRRAINHHIVPAVTGSTKRDTGADAGDRVMYAKFGLHRLYGFGSIKRTRPHRTLHCTTVHVSDEELTGDLMRDILWRHDGHNATCRRLLPIEAFLYSKNNYIYRER
jgi:hypothetical protein